MTWVTETETDDAGIQIVTAWDDTAPETKYLTYRIDSTSERIEFFPRDEFPVETVVLDGFEKLPTGFRPAGYMTQNLVYWLNKKLSGRKVESLTISRTASDLYRKIPGKDAYRIVLSFDSLSSLSKGLNAISRAPPVRTPNRLRPGRMTNRGGVPGRLPTARRPQRC